MTDRLLKMEQVAEITAIAVETIKSHKNSALWLWRIARDISDNSAKPSYRWLESELQQAITRLPKPFAEVPDANERRPRRRVKQTTGKVIELKAKPKGPSQDELRAEIERQRKRLGLDKQAKAS